MQRYPLVVDAFDNASRHPVGQTEGEQMEKCQENNEDAGKSTEPE